jgi:ABC-type nitrate/sulfonate/bicarbonate transport system substrate-binding protein
MLKNFRTKGALLVLAALLLVSMTACGAKTDSAVSADGEGTESLVIKTPSRLSCESTMFVVADKLGYFEEEGLTVEYTGETESSQLIPSILSGDNDVYDFHVNTIATVVAGGADVVAVVANAEDPGEDANPELRHMWWFAKGDSGITSLEDLKSKDKIKVSTLAENVCADGLTKVIFEKAGIDLDKVEFVVIPDIEASEALQQGLIDVAVVHPPFYKLNLDNGAVKIADTFDTGWGPAAGQSYHVFSREFTEKNPKAVKAFVRAIVKAQKYANENPAEAAEWTEEHIGIPVSATHYYADSSKINEDYVTPWIQATVDAGLIKEGQIKASDIITHEFE